MESWLKQILDQAGESPGAIHYLVLALATLLEYVFPPFPGDMAVLLGAFLVGAKRWPLAAVLVVVNAGAVIGFSLDYFAGRWIGARDARWRQVHPRWRRLGAAIDRVEASFRRRGSIYIAANRFVPALRAVFFIAAGMAGLPYWKVLLWGLISAVAWNALIFAVGLSVGYHWESLVSFLRAYSIIAWLLVALALVVAFVVFRRRRRRRGDSGQSPGATDVGARS